MQNEETKKSLLEMQKQCSKDKLNFLLNNINTLKQQLKKMEEQYNNIKQGLDELNNKNLIGGVTDVTAILNPEIYNQKNSQSSAQLPTNTEMNRTETEQDKTSQIFIPQFDQSSRSYPKNFTTLGSTQSNLSGYPFSMNQQSMQTPQSFLSQFSNQPNSYSTYYSNQPSNYSNYYPNQPSNYSNYYPNQPFSINYSGGNTAADQLNTKTIQSTYSQSLPNNNSTQYDSNVYSNQGNKLTMSQTDQSITETNLSPNLSNEQKGGSSKKYKLT